MRYSTLGSSGIKVSALALGSWAFAGDKIWGSQEERESVATVAAAIDAGINFFDTAEMYGDGKAEEVLGKALLNRRHEVVIASKVSSANLAKDKLVAACERSLRRLGTDYIDLYQIHWPSREVPLEETVRAMELLVRQGKVRALGVSNFGVKDLEDILKLGAIVTDQLPYSLLWRAVEAEIEPKCAANGVGILCYSPLSQGLLTGKYQAADEVPAGLTITRYYSHTRSGARHGEAGLEEATFAAIAAIRKICAKTGESMGNVAMAWLLKRPSVASVLVGARAPRQLRENVKAAAVELPPDLVAALTAATEQLKEKVGRNPDMWEGQAKSRFR